jgi:superfamily II DNA/RNA helicase
LRAMQSARAKAAEESQSRAKATTQAFEEPKLKNTPVPSSSRAGGLESPKRKKLVIDHQRGTIAVDGEDNSEGVGRVPAFQNLPLRCIEMQTPQIVGFTSAKLAYLVDQVIAHQKSEKIIIFYDTNNVAFWIAEALELLGVRFLIYANTLTTARRATYLATFNHNDDFRVLLMDLKQAAHGLHVACASRVYIVNPIWQPNIESQAIKRAHRIGQKRPVHVETLVLSGTLEEKMLKRRKEMSSMELQKAKSILDDLTMAEVIKNERFIKFNSSEGIAIFDAEGSIRWNTPEDAKVVRLAVPQPLFGQQKNEQEPEEGLITTPGDESRDRGHSSSSRVASDSANGNESSDEPRAQKKRKMTVRILG